MAHGIAFAIYGNWNKYIQGLIENLDFIRSQGLIDLKPYVYVCPSIAEPVSALLSEHSDSVVVLDEVVKNTAVGMFSRFNIFHETELSSASIRDADSLLTLTEVYILKNWLSSERSAYTIRGCDKHVMPIMGGLFGIRNTEFNMFLGFVDRYRHKYCFRYGDDQKFLADYIYPYIKGKLIVYTNDLVYPCETVCAYDNDDEFVIGGYHFDIQSMNTVKSSVKKTTLPFWIVKMLRYRGLNLLKVKGWFFVGIVK
jgi:hypothetical protein